MTVTGPEPTQETTAAAVAASVDPAALLESVIEAVRIPSVTPNEAAFARWVRNQLDEAGWHDVRLVDVEPGRPNVYGAAGRGEGRSLILAGHLDTVHADDWTEHWADSERADPFAGHIIDGAIWARGAADQKAGICATIEAVRSVHRAGFEIAGTVTGLFVCDEESGQPGSGRSVGMKAAVADLVTGAADAASTPPADFAIYTEPTTSAIYTAQMGFIIADFTITGRSAYFGTPELGIDALRAGHDLLSELWRHNEFISAATDPHRLIGKASLLVTSVRSGGNIAVPGSFELSLIRKLLPGDDIAGAAAALRLIGEQIAEQHRVAVEVAFPAGRDHDVGGTPDEIADDTPGVSELARSIETTVGESARIQGAPYWSEKPLLASLGVPGVYFGPGDIAHCHTPFERLDIDELITATRILAHFVASWCGLQQQPNFKERT